MKQRAIIGIDEVGRGPLAGPVMVCAVWVPVGFVFAGWPLLRDSKVMSEKAREEVALLARYARQKGHLDYVVAQRSAKEIDKQGISVAIKSALTSALETLVNRQAKQTGESTEAIRDSVQVLLDGGLKAPSQFSNQLTIIKGDAKEQAISLASIIAKIERDKYMVKRGGEAAYCHYGFATHKGYGTAAHRRAIAEHGLSDLHRRSFCRRFKV